MAKAKPYDVDLSKYDKSHEDKEKIGEGFAVPCRICEEVFSRIRLTWRYCEDCGRAFCEGEHGTFAFHNRGRCLQHEK